MTIRRIVKRVIDGNPNPSQEDLAITEKIIKAGKEIGIKVLDHMIIGRDDHWNWKEK